MSFSAKEAANRILDETTTQDGQAVITLPNCKSEIAKIIQQTLEKKAAEWDVPDQVSVDKRGNDQVGETTIYASYAVLLEVQNDIRGISRSAA